MTYLADLSITRTTPVGITTPISRQEQDIEDEGEENLPYEFRRKSKQVRMHRYIHTIPHYKTIFASMKYEADN